jgi:signal transduction histidine kinase
MSTPQPSSLARTGPEVVDVAAVELRRIERDLHDGAQARLAAVAVHLGVAAELFDTDPDTARVMLAHARSAARTAMAELRSLVRGIQPPLLADRGLVGAVRALALDSPIPVVLELRWVRRLPAPVEAAAYFTVAEALANAIKHSGAGRIAISVGERDGGLLVRVVDDGCGGADPAGGTGLSGVARRLVVFDGRLRVTSPAGGPTVVEALLPSGR